MLAGEPVGFGQEEQRMPGESVRAIAGIGFANGDLLKAKERLNGDAVMGVVGQAIACFGAGKLGA